MPDYKSLFRRDMEVLHYISRRLDELNEAYIEFREELKDLPKE